MWISCIDTWKCKTAGQGKVGVFFQRVKKSMAVSRFGIRNPLVGHFHPLIFVIKRNCRVLYLRF